MRYWILPLALAMIHAGVSEAAVQKRHESTGRYSIEADLVDCEAGWVVLRKIDGKLIELPVTDLSRADRRWVHNHLAPTDKMLQRSPTESPPTGLNLQAISANCRTRGSASARRNR